MNRRYGSAPRARQTYRRRPGAYAILLGQGGRVLLTEQTTKNFVEVQLPGGGIDPGEAALPALAREVLEETGYSCRILRRLGTYRRFTYMEEYGFHAEKICQIYLGRVGLQLGAPSEVGHRALWVDRHQACDLVESAGDGAFLKALLG